MYSSQQAAPNLYLQPPAAEIASLGSYQHSSDRNYSKRSREDQCSASSTHREDTEVQKKRKLVLVKCERCRIDKQKCAPTDRIWPARCQRCITKDFPCSEGKRAQRGSKYVLPEPAPLSSSEKISEEVPGKNFSDLDFLLGYQDILSEASSQLLHLQKEIFELFSWPFSTRRSECDPHGDLNAALVSISGTTKDLTCNQIALSSQYELLAALSNQTPLESFLSYSTTCQDFCYLCEQGGEEGGERICEKIKEYSWSSNSSIVEDTIKDFKQAGAICQEVLVRQAQVAAMIRCTRWAEHLNQMKGCAAQIHTRIMSINARAIPMIRESKYSYIPTQQVDRFLSPPVQDENNNTGDFLRRTIAHRVLDQLPDNQINSNLEDFPLIEVKSFNQVRDRLGRTLLHLLCQKGSYKLVQRSLQIGADPSATTIYGHLPLHYAAQRGHYEICELLSRYKEMFEIGQIDKHGNTACDYASWENHQRVKSLLEDARDEQMASRMTNEE